MSVAVQQAGVDSGRITRDQETKDAAGLMD
jgi:hypothetical protein